MKIVLSCISESVDNMKEFLEKVDADVSRLSSNDALLNTFSTLGQVLKLTKSIIDQLSKVRHERPSITDLVVKRLIVVIRHIRYSTHHGPLFPVFTR
jgi:phage terminase large subunit